MATITLQHNGDDYGLISFAPPDHTQIAHFRLVEYGKNIDLRLVEIMVFWDDKEKFLAHYEAVDQMLIDWDRYITYSVGVTHLLSLLPLNVLVSR